MTMSVRCGERQLAVNIMVRVKPRRACSVWVGGHLPDYLLPTHRSPFYLLPGDLKLPMGAALHLYIARLTWSRSWTDQPQDWMAGMRYLANSINWSNCLLNHYGFVYGSYQIDLCVKFRACRQLWSLIANTYMTFNTRWTEVSRCVDV